VTVFFNYPPVRADTLQFAPFGIRPVAGEAPNLGSADLFWYETAWSGGIIKESGTGVKQAFSQPTVIILIIGSHLKAST
jgi:hypothetical protein